VGAEGGKDVSAFTKTLAACVEYREIVERLEAKIADQGLTIVTIEDIVTNDKRSNKAKVLAIQYVLRKEAQP
jgi:uncharacterized protein (DUF302 family)